VPDEALSSGALPSGWPKSVKSAVLHVISLAQFAIVAARGWAANAINPRARQASEMERLTGEVALHKEEIRIKDTRLGRIDPRRRPIILDHFSRKVMGIAVFRKQPNSGQVCDFLAKTIRGTGARPKYAICDKGPQFWCKPFKRWCRRRKIRPRFGAVGQYGSIAVLERFIRTLKEEGLRRVLVPLSLGRMRLHVHVIIGWYNTHRPHSWLVGRTPDERYRRIPSACRRPRWEPRSHWPADSPCAGPQAQVRGKPGVSLALVVAITKAAGTCQS